MNTKKIPNKALEKQFIKNDIYTKRKGIETLKASLDLQILKDSNSIPKITTAKLHKGKIYVTIESKIEIGFLLETVKNNFIMHNGTVSTKWIALLQKVNKST